MKKTGLGLAGILSFVLLGSSAHAFSITKEIKYSGETRYNLSCNSGKNTYIYIVHSVGKYCTPSFTCDRNFNSVARWACGE